MIVTKIEEIRDIIPTARWRDPAKLLGAIADEETSVLEPVLGDSLLDYIQGRYDELIDAYSQLTCNSEISFHENDKKDIELIRQLQKVVVLRMVSNRVATLSASFNEGGGLNRMATEGYDGATLDELKELKMEYWRNSIKALDNALYMLEKDARSENPVYADMWKESEYYFHHSDLLFPTMRSLIPFFSITKNEKRLEYIELLPDIRWCQNTYILPMLGQDLIDLLLSESNDAQRKALQLIRVALGVFLTVRTTKNPPAVLESSAHQALQTAISYMQKNQDEFGEAITYSQIYIAPPSSEPQDSKKPIPPFKPRFFSTLIDR